VWQAAAVDREFHATFSASWRRYVYLLPLRHQQQHVQQQQQHVLLPRYTDELTAALQHPAQHAAAAAAESQEQQQGCQQQQQQGCQQQQQQGCQQQQQQRLLSALQAGDVDPASVNALLQQLQGKPINYYAYARDTPRGKDCECTLHVARASLVHIPAPAASPAQRQVEQRRHAEAAAGAAEQRDLQQQQQGCVPCLCIELVGDRFLRKMVRVLVATAVREAVLLQQDQAAAGKAAHADDNLMQGSTATAATAAAAAVGAEVSSETGSSKSGVGVQALVALADSMDRQATAPPAPALGLCFAAVGY
jgi:tRNA U38,U39,U40 pseudouridine synthase TruA